MKRHIAIIVALLIISALLFQSCRVHCSAFPEWLCKYAPYVKGSTVSFKNENDSVIEINFYLDAKESKQDVGAINNIDVSIRSFDNDIVVVGQSYKDDFSGINPYDYGHEQKLGDTIVLQNKKYDDFSDMVIVKGKGLAEFYDKENNCTWRLVELRIRRCVYA